MASTTHPEERPGLLEIAYKAVQATLATLAVYRGARSAIDAWKGVYAMIRGPQTKEPAGTQSIVGEPEES